MPDYSTVMVLLLSFLLPLVATALLLAALWAIMSVLYEIVRSWIDAFAERTRYPRF